MKIDSLKIPSKIIKRSTYLDMVAPYVGQNIIKVLTGQRRVGKSYLLFQIIQWIAQQDSKASFIYINKEDLAFSFIKTASDLNKYVLENASKSNKTYVFIDEIQDIENFEEALRSLLLHQNLDLYCTGSNANLLSGDIAGYISGRYIAIEVFSLSYPEFIAFHKLTEDKDSLDKYLKFGGLPYLIHLELKDDIVFEYLKNIYQSIVYRDIINRYAIRNVNFLEQLVTFLAAHTGSIFSAKKISDFLKSQRIKMAPNQVQTYIHHLVSAFLVHKVSRFDLIGKRMFEIGEKYYFENLGIRNGLWGYRLEDRGKIMENAVYNHLIFKGYRVQVGVMEDKEIDFMASKDGEKMYIQVALTIDDSSTLKREFGILQQIKDNYPKKVITMENFSGNTLKGIQNESLREFLMNSV
ncbi:ATP-binding protein [Flavobacteriaceae bacterium 14752]|uniref:ATP-binding protein n=1 Tax=Mesohalobacter salilacus TaxID=2491711 RepID=UPI000F6356FF|nr:ATP-binding protein [Flavobacteriaceae bacterium 14752]